jgi:hypothetical protein
MAPLRAAADAIIRTQAMFASTIAEYFVEDGRVLVDLEIGVPDLETFRNLLPDEILAKLGPAPEPLATRLERFFAEDLVIAGPDGPLPGRLLEMGPRERLKRDPITGEPLPPAEGEEPEVVVFARLEYALAGRPETLTLHGPRGGNTSVGFVAYHARIPANDFRYLTPSQTLRLDWDDPWYTRFERRALRRRYFEPMSGFLYVEPYEVRKEIVARPLDLQHWVDLGLAGHETIPVEIQPELLRRAAAFLREHQKVVIDGQEIEPELARVNFLERSLRTSRVIDPPVELDLHSAILGAIFVYPLEKPLPDHVTLDWDLWSERITRVPAASVDQAGPLPTFLEPDFRVLEWRNFLRFPELPTLRAVAPPPGPLQRAAGLGSWPLLAVALGLGWWARRGSRRRLALTAAVMVATGGAFWLARETSLSGERSGEVVGALLHNVYRAFDFRDEERIYDLLARSVDGDLLADIYLQTRRGLELASQGGARAKVKEVELVELATQPADGGGFAATAVWNVAGSVGHWGHVHQRANRYRAELSIAPREGAWKLVGLEILDEERL